MNPTLLTFLIGTFVKLDSGALLHGLSQYSIQNMVLPGSVFRVLGQTTFQQCYRLCMYSSDCSSINWQSSDRQCQLNMQHVGTGTLQVSLNNVYMPVEPIQPQSHTCGSRPCTGDQVCVPVLMSTSHICLHTVSALATLTASSEQTTKITTGSSPEETTLSNPTTATTPEATTQDPTTTTLEETSQDPTTTTPEATTEDPTTTTPEATTEDPTTTTPEATTEVPTTTPEETTPDPTTTTPAATTQDPTTATPESTTTDPTTTTPEASTTQTHEETCQVEADCDIFQGTTCSGGLCTCSIGHDLDVAESACVELSECLSFRDNFTLYARHAIMLYDEQNRTPYTVSECVALCLQSTTYTCKSFEIYNGGCYTQKVNWYDVPIQNRLSDFPADHYQRRCNW